MSKEAAFVLGLLITAFMYLFCPIIFCVLKIKLTQSQIIKAVVANGICVFLIDTALAVLLLDVEPAIPAAVLWSFIAYAIMKKKCLKQEDNHEQNQIVQNCYCSNCGSVFPIGTNYCDRCGTKLFANSEIKPTQPSNNDVRICVSPIDEAPSEYGRFLGKDMRIERNDDTTPTGH